MEEFSTGSHTAVDAARYARSFENEVRFSEEWSDRAEKMESFITDGAFGMPDIVVPLYENLVNSDVEVVRRVAVDGIIRVLLSHPIEGAKIWGKLLKDSSGVARVAYRRFDELCSEVESGKLPDANLSGVVADMAQ